MLKTGMPTSISIGALPNITPDAVIEYIAPKSTEDNGANTFELKAAITVPDSVNLRAGYSANANIILEKADSVITIPESVVEWGADSSFVYILTDSLPKQTFKRVAIQTGVSDGMNIEVKSGITTDVSIRGFEKK